MVSTGSRILSGHCGVLEPDQWGLVRQLRLEALFQSPGAFLGNYDDELAYSEDDWRKTFEDASWHGFFVAAAAPAKSKIAGIAKSSRLSQFPDERYVESFWVHPADRRRQVGRRMLESISREALSEGRRVVRLSVLRSNDQAIRTFGRLGLVTIVPERSSELEVCLELALA